MKRIAAFILALTMVMALVACGGDKPTSSTPSNPTQSTNPSEPSKPATSEPEKPAEPENHAEPKILNQTFKTAAGNLCGYIDQDSASTGLQGLISSGLYGTLPIDGKASLVPVLAASEPVDVNGDGKTWNITISDKAMFENGEKMNADTFIYTFKMGLDPKLVMAKASYLAKGSHAEIVNALNYYKQGGESATPVAWEDVGIKKIDEMTIQISLVNVANAEKVMRHLSGVKPLYEPLFKECLSADGTSTTYGSTADKYMGCGPYKLTNWVVGSLRELKKNENYIRADLIKLDGLKYILAEDSGTIQQLFEKGEIDYMSLDTAAKAKYGDDPRIRYNPTNIVLMIEINTGNPEQPILNNETFRKAMYYATNRPEVADVVSEEPAAVIIGLKCTPFIDGTTFREYAANAGYEPANYGYDPTMAKQLFDQALKEEGLTSLKLTLNYKADDNYYGPLAEYIKENWQNVFGTDKFELILNPLPSSVNSSTRKAWREDPACYEITMCSWNLSAATNSAIGALRVYTYAQETRNAPYGYEVLDNLYSIAMTDDYALDVKKQTDFAMDMEKYMIQHAVTIPLLHDVTYSIFSDRVILPLDNIWNENLGYAQIWGDIAQ